MSFPNDLLYAKTHEWVKQENGRIRVGITDHAQKEITDVVYVELPAVGKTLTQAKPCAVVESVKAAFDIYAPVSGTVVEINEKLSSSPELVNSSPYAEGYFFVIEPTNTGELDNLMSPDAYKKELG